MGLDTSHDCWHGSCGAFNVWRRMIAHAAKFPPLDLMDCFCGSDEIHEMPERIREYLPISWVPLGGDVLTKLLHHSDCDGILWWGDCDALADRLYGLLPNLGVDDFDWRYVATERFSVGLRKAYAAKEDVEFH